MQRLLILITLCLAAPLFAGIDFEKEIWPIIKDKCVKCHQAAYTDEKGRLKKPKADLRLDNKSFFLKGGENGRVIIPGDPNKSSLYQLISLDHGDDDIMPPKGDPLTKDQIELIKFWIMTGADFGKWKGMKGSEKDVAVIKKVNVLEIDVIYQKLSKGLRPMPNSSLDKLRRGEVFVQPLSDSSPLLEIKFNANSGNYGNASVKALMPYRNHVTILNLGGIGITDMAARDIAQFKKLTTLDLHDTQIGNQALSSFRNLPNLRVLNLHSTKVTDVGMRALGACKELRKVYLWNTGVTPKGVKLLIQLNPKVKVDLGTALDALSTMKPAEY